MMTSQNEPQVLEDLRRQRPLQATADDRPPARPPEPRQMPRPDESRDTHLLREWCQR